MNKAIEAKIEKALANYIKMFPDEAAAFMEQIKIKRKEQKDEFASTGKGSHVAERAILDVPATVDTMFSLALTEDELALLRSDKGVRWMAKNYPIFRIPEKI